MPKDVDWLLVGAGDIACKRVAPALHQTPGSRIVGVCDLVGDRAGTLARQLGVSAAYVDLDTALQQSDAQAVYIATPVLCHVPQAVAALRSGRHVLVEKPLGIDAADAAQAADTAQRSDLVAGCAYFRRAFARYQHAQQMLAAGTFGKVALVRMTYFSWFDPSPGDPKYWRVVKSKSGGGVLSDIATHMFDVMIGLLGVPQRVFAKLSTQTHEYEVEDSAAIIMEYAAGTQVVASFNWNSKTWSHEFEVIGTEAKVKWHPFDTGPIVQTVGRDIQSLDMVETDNVHAPIVADFIAAVRDKRPPLVPLDEAAKTNQLLDAVLRSAESGREVIL